MKKLSYLLILSLSIILLGSCSKDDAVIEPENNKILIAKATLSDNGEISILGDKELSIGYQKVYVQFKKNGQLQSSGNLSFSPIMDMGTMTHGAPSSVLKYTATTKSFEAYVVFTMSSGESGSWALKFQVNGKEVSVPVVVKAAATGNVPVKTVTASNGKRYVLALVQPAAPKTGMNELEVMVFLRETMFSFPEQNGLTFDFNPQMTSMTHGSPNNEAPVGLGNGRYKGKVNFTMTGDWRLFFNLKEGNTELAKDVFLDILF